MAMEAIGASVRDRMMVKTMTPSPNAGLTKIEQRIIDFLIVREDKLRGAWSRSGVSNAKG